VERKLRSVTRSLEVANEAARKIDEFAEGGLNGDDPAEAAGEDRPARVEVVQPSLTRMFMNATTEALFGLSLVIVLLFYFLASGDRALEKLVELMPRWGQKRKVVEITRDIQDSVSRYLITTAVINIALGGFIAMGLFLAGLSNPLLWGIVAALLNFLPFVGAIAGIILVALAGLIEYDLPWAAVFPAIYVVCNIVEANFVTPMLLGQRISLHPAWLMVFFILVAWMWGMGGALIAVPVLAVIKISCDHIAPLNFIGTFLGR
jgi:predicted PurR-regulated permease PerM